MGAGNGAFKYSRRDHARPLSARIGDPRHAAELTTIERPPDGAEEVGVMIDRTLLAHEMILEKIRKGIKATEESGDWGTNDLLMGDVLRRHEQQVWFLAEHVVDVPLVSA